MTIDMLNGKLWWSEEACGLKAPWPGMSLMSNYTCGLFLCLTTTQKYITDKADRLAGTHKSAVCN